MNGTSELMQSELLFRGVLESQLGELQTMVRQLEFAEKNQAEAQ